MRAEQNIGPRERVFGIWENGARAKRSKEGGGQIQRVRAITRIETLNPSQTTTNQPSRVLLVITYNPVLCSILTIIQRH